MRFGRGICVATLIFQGVPWFVPAQAPTVTPSQSPSAAGAEEKPRSAKETRTHLEQLACGPSHVHLLHHTQEGPQSLPAAPIDKGLLYVIRTKYVGGSAVQAKLGMDGKWVGVNRIGNYFYLEVDPGPHYFCMKTWGTPPGLLSLVIEKGKTYYLRQHITMGGDDLDLLDETEGKKYVAKYRRSFFEEKQDK